MPGTDRYLFEKEEQALQEARAILENQQHKKSPLYNAFSNLFQEYKRMLKQLRILVKMGDKQQLRLNELNNQLDRSNRFIKKTFGQYLSDDIVDTILESPEGTSLGGEKRVVTTLMSDLRGFTAITERLPAEAVVRMINIYLEIMTDIILKHQGTIDEFFGDGILALFGAPVSRDDDARRAVACAMEMQLAMEEVNRQNREEGFPLLAMGVGINTGELVVGNIGSQKRTKYGVVGSNVNLTFRIESYTVGGQVFISESTRQSCGPILRIDDQMDVMPKGVKNPITIYDIGGIFGEYNLLLPEKEEIPLAEPEKPIPIKFSILTGKHACDTAYPGTIERIAESAEEAEILSPVEINKLANLKVSVLDRDGNETASEIYGKVIKRISGSQPRFRVNFTSMPPEAKALLEKITRTGKI
jgi:adenylate cyclase